MPRPSEEGHGARSGELDVGRCGHAARVVTAVHSFTAVGACPRTRQQRNHPEGAAVAVRMFGSIVIGFADPSFVHKCASDSITCQRFELWADVGESEVTKRRGNGAGWPGRVGGRWNEGVGRLIIPEAPVVAVRMLGSIVIAAADPSFFFFNSSFFLATPHGATSKIGSSDFWAAGTAYCCLYCSFLSTLTTS